MDDDAREVLSVAASPAGSTPTSSTTHSATTTSWTTASARSSSAWRRSCAAPTGSRSPPEPWRAPTWRSAPGSTCSTTRGSTRRCLSSPGLTDQAVEDGARDLTLFMARSQLQPENVDRLTAQLTHVVASAAACGGLARVVLMTSGMTGEEIRNGCRLAVSCGVDMVQGGAAMTGDRASLSKLTQMRRELGAGVLLKWMAPVPASTGSSWRGPRAWTGSGAA